MNRLSDYQFWMLRLVCFIGGVYVLDTAYNFFHDNTILITLSGLGALAIIVSIGSYIADPYRLLKMKYKKTNPQKQEEK